MNKYRIDVLKNNSGLNEMSINVAASSNYSSLSIPKYMINCSMPSRIGLLWDGEGWYRVDKNLNLISDSNFNPDETFPYNQITTETIDGEIGTIVPRMYAHAEYVPSIDNECARVYWIDEGPTSSNHIIPSFTYLEEEKDYIWLKSNIEDNGNPALISPYEYMNIYDYCMIQKLLLIEYSPGKYNIDLEAGSVAYHGGIPATNGIIYGGTYRNINNLWDRYFILGAEFNGSGNSGTLSIWNLKDITYNEYRKNHDTNTISTNHSAYDFACKVNLGNLPINKSIFIKGKWCIEKLYFTGYNGQGGYYDYDVPDKIIDMSDFIFDISGELNSANNRESSPYAMQWSANSGFYAPYSSLGFLGMGFIDYNISLSNCLTRRRRFL